MNIPEVHAAIDYRNNPELRVILLAYFGRIEQRAINVPLRSGVGSLLLPRKSVSDYVHKDLHADPLDFREYVIEEFWKWIRLRTDSRERWAQSALRYLQPVEEAEKTI